MRPFLYDPAITNPLDVGRRDHMECVVEDIRSHRGPHQRSKIQFLVKWLNYPVEKTLGSLTSIFVILINFIIICVKNYSINNTVDFLTRNAIHEEFTSYF